MSWIPFPCRLGLHVWRHLTTWNTGERDFRCIRCGLDRKHQ